MLHGCMQADNHDMDTNMCRTTRVEPMLSRVFCMSHGSGAKGPEASSGRCNGSSDEISTGVDGHYRRESDKGARRSLTRTQSFIDPMITTMRLNASHELAGTLHRRSSAMRVLLETGVRS